MSFGDLYTVPAGAPQDPNLPPIDLPQVEAAPRRQPVQITTKGAWSATPEDRSADPFANVPEWSPEPSKAAGSKGDPFADVPEWQPAKPPSAKEGGRDIGPGESAGIGAREGITFGGYPAIHGAIAAGKTEEERGRSEEDYLRGVMRDPVGALGGEAGALIKGLSKLGYEHLIAPLLGINPGGLSGQVTGDQAGPATKVYREEREAALEEQKSAQKQNPGSYLTGQLIGGVAAPIPGAGAATGLRGGAALGRALKAGGIGGALYGGGTALSEGKDAGDIAMDAGIGGGVGLAAGGLIHGATELGGAALSRGRDLVQGVFNPKALAERKFAEAMRTAQRTGTEGIDREGYQSATAPLPHEVDTPVHNIDLGGDATRDLGRMAANVSPEARQIIAGPLAERQDARTQRFVDRVYRLMGGTLDRGNDRRVLEQEGRRINAPAYDAAYANKNPIGASAEMQTLMDAPAIQEAMGKALTEGKNRAIKDGVKFVDPPLKMTQDGLQFRTRPDGSPIFPNIQFWDYVQRELRDMAEDASKSKGALYEGLRKDLNKVLDKEVPEFGAARSGAARFFGAQDAVEAGEFFATGKKDFRDIREAQRAIAQFSPPERELFARSVMDTITEALKDKPNWGTIDRLFTSPRAMEKISAAIGPARAKELEVALRAETMAQKTKERIIGGSTTFRQWADGARHGTLGRDALHGGIGLGGLATFEALKEGDVNPKHLAAAALTVGAYKIGARHIDANYMRHLAETLMSQDPAVANRAMRAVARSPSLFKAFRAGTEAGTRVGAHDLGAAGLATGIGEIYNEVMAKKHHEDRSDDQSVINQSP